MNEQSPPLRAHNIHRSFKSGSSELKVLSGVDIELQAGEVCALRGASGSGKSSLLHILGLLDRADQGQVEINGYQVGQLGAHAQAKLRAEHIGFVFQQFQLLPELNALENILIPRRLVLGARWWQQRKQEKEHALKALDSVNLHARAHHLPNQLSGGEQQRVAIARAMISQPSILLADEPTGNLDHQNGSEVLELMFELAQESGTAILLATHDSVVASSCGRQLTLIDGALSGEALPTPNTTP